MTRPPVLFLLFLACLFAAAPASAAGLNPFGDLPIDVRGGEIVHDKERNAGLVLGYAAVSIGGRTIKAKNIVVFLDTNELYAEGDVSYQEPGLLLYCDQFYLDIKNYRGEARNVRAMGEAPSVKAAESVSVESHLGGPDAGRSGFTARTGLPYNRGFLHAQKIVSHGGTNQELHQAWVSPDNSPDPRVRIAASAARMRRNEKVEAWGAKLFIGKVPVFYFPYILYDLKYNWPWMRISGGNSSDWGAYVLTSWGLDLDPKDEWFFRPEKLWLDIDWRNQRGWAGGATLKYELGHRDSYGKISGYFLNEYGISDKDDLERAREDTEYGDLYAGEDRGKFDWWHYQDLPGEWDLRGEVHYLSDRDFLKEYFPRQYYEDKEPESVLDLRKLNDKYVLEIVARARVNDFASQAEYLPELRLTVPGLRLGDSPFFFRNDFNAGIINKRWDEKITKQTLKEEEQYRVKDGYDYGNFARVHDEMRFYTPIALGRHATLTPYVGGMATYYEDLYDDGDGHLRTAALYGADLTARYYANYGWGRHIVEPTVSFSGSGDPTIKADNIYPVDHIDYYSTLHTIGPKLHQSFQVKRPMKDAAGQPTGEYEVVDLIDFDISTTYIPSDRESGKVNAGNHWTDVNFDLIYRPRPYLTFNADLDWNAEDGQVTRYSAGMDWRARDDLRVYLTHRNRRGDTRLEPSADRSDETTLALRWIASDKYSFEYAMTREWAESTEDIDHGLSKYRISVIRNAKIFDLIFSFARDLRKDDNTFYVEIAPIGIPPLDRSTSLTNPVAKPIQGRYEPPVIEEVALP